MFLRYLERSHTYKPDRQYYAVADTFNHEILSVRDRLQNTIDIRFKRLSEEYLIIFSHGNSANISGLGTRYSFFEELNFSYLAYDYPGYGRSTGTPGEEGLYASHHAVIDLAGTLGFPPEKIILHGLSLGGAVAVEGACTYKNIRGLIIEASFESSHAMARVIFGNIPVHRLVRERFRSLHRIGEVNAPVLVIHGTEDETVPYEQGYRLFEAATEPKFLYSIKGAGHANLIEHGGERYREIYKSFISSLSVPSELCT